jgi:hypothetical protein
MPNSPSILVIGTRVEAQVCRVDDGKDTILLDDLGNFLPLLSRRVTAGRVVSAGVQDNSRPMVSSPEALHDTLKVEFAILVVGHLRDVEPDGSELEVVI